VALPPYPIRKTQGGVPAEPFKRTTYHWGRKLVIIPHGSASREPKLTSEGILINAQFSADRYRQQTESQHAKSITTSQPKRT
jgi:hypothetical protein